MGKGYGRNKLGDLGGEFIGGWDDGGGVDWCGGLLRCEEDLFGCDEEWFEK